MKTKRLLIVMIFLGYQGICQQKLSVKEMITNADNIFIGTVDSIYFTKNEKGNPLTHVMFRNVESCKSVSGNVEIQYAGGEIDDKVVRVSHTPMFDRGKTYLIFSYDKSKGYFDPIAGAMYRIENDRKSSDKYLVTSSGSYLTQINNDYFVNSTRQITSINNGIPTYKNPDERFIEKAQPQSLSGSVIVTPAIDNWSAPVQPIMSMNDFKKLFHERYNMTFVSDPKYPQKIKKNESDIAQKTTATPTISYCGFQSLTINMQQLPTSFTPWYDINNNSMWVWNQYMDIFRVLAPDGNYGNNGVNEFGGFPTSAALASTYGSGFSWGPSSLAMTIYYWSGSCTQITEADVFANPAVFFTTNIWDQVNGTAHMFMLTMMHELGHVWGLMNGTTETYDYSLPTVMQGGAMGIVEDGVGIHSADAYLLRDAYDAQTPIINSIDIGVESYFAPGGLVSSTTDALSYFSGNLMTIYGITVENNSHSAVSNLNLNIYLSPDPIINSFDYYVGTIYWTTFNAESYNSYNYTLNVPYNIPSGYYYVGGAVTYNTTTNDDFVGNNATFLPRRIYVYGLASEITNVNVPTPITVTKTNTPNTFRINNNFNEEGIVNVYNTIGQLVLSQNSQIKEIVLPNVSGLFVAELIIHGEKHAFKLIN